MKPNVSALERAFELARTGRFTTIDDLKRKLRDEGYPLGQLVGPYLLKQLQQVMMESDPAATKL
jgi:hypothetical protein